MKKAPVTFWCNNCERWTLVSGSRLPVCGSCGEQYVCDECGFEIDRYGNCLRFSVTDEHCPTDEVQS